MNNPEIVLVTDKNNFFGQTRKPWVPINLEIFIRTLNLNGISVNKLSFDEIALNIDNLTGKVIFYAFSQKSNTREYIKSLILHLQKSNKVIPNFDMLFIHENKGYQELLKKSLGVPSLKSYYINDINSIDKLNIDFPIVFKTPDGSNGNGVFLCHCKNDIFKIYRKLNKLPLKIKFDLLRRKYLRTKKTFDFYPEYNNLSDYIQFKQYSENFAPFILQEFVANLKCDYRVLILFDKYFVIKRLTKDNDFRASGSKKFIIEEEINPEILNFAELIYNKFDSPYLSIDVVDSGSGCHLIEYQALHFGVSALVRNNNYYQKTDNNWKRYDAKTKIEEEMAISLSKYLNKIWSSQN